MTKYNERDVYNHLYIKIFNDEVYERFPDLGKYIKEDYFMVTGFLEDFLIDLYDDSKSVIRPFLDERTTYAYRMHYGIGNFGFSVSNSFIGKELSLTGERIGQLLSFADNSIINMIISEYKLYKDNKNNPDYVDIRNATILIEELGLSREVYNKLKRQGINTVDEIDLDYLKSLHNGFGKRTCDAIDKGISRIRNK